MVVSEGQKLGALAVLILCLFYYGFSLLHARQPGTGTSCGKVSPSPIPWGRQEPESVAIQVRGSRADGIYFMPQGTGLAQIFKAAGIPEDHLVTGSPDREISDGALLAISPSGEVAIAEMDAAARLALGLRIDLNRASEGDLTLVPGIGQRMASQIMQLRLEKGAFRDLSDLTAVPGIKEKKLNSLKDYLMVKQAP
ncbi:MAG: helix-hairpin-helix domain-containing protein [Proteobacteria bacterium]|nr:helix-hairpin-helix domain-containing protein [Pseudomonadota bacterium]